MEKVEWMVKVRASNPGIQNQGVREFVEIHRGKRDVDTKNRPKAPMNVANAKTVTHDRSPF